MITRSAIPTVISIVHGSGHPDLMANLHARIRAARKAAGMTQAELARRVGIRSQGVNMWESGKNTPSRDNILAVARVTGAPVSWLLVGGTLPEQNADGTFAPIEARGRFIPMISVHKALQVPPGTGGSHQFPVHFPCGEQSFFIEIPNESNAPEHPKGTRWAIDPDVNPEPGDLVMAVANETAVFGEYRTEAGPSGVVAVVRPLNERWAAVRSDGVGLRIIGVMTEYVRRQRRV